jgi:hypothetical protein
MNRNIITNTFKKNSNTIFSKPIISNSQTTKTFFPSIIPSSSTSSNNKTKILFISLFVLIILCIIIYLIICTISFNKTQCYEKKSFIKYIFDFKDHNVCIKEKAPVIPPPKPVKPAETKMPNLSIIEDKKKEVFHISNQDYTYEQAKCKCESYNGRLATKAEVTDAYNNGANWCTYGWSEKQSAYYPVQKCDWDKMQKENERLPDKEKKFCGLPGLNGGYFANPLIKFGVNCYGEKPKGVLNKPKEPYCPPMNFCKLENNYQASHKLETDEIVGFNNDKWSMNI